MVDETIARGARQTRHPGRGHDPGAHPGTVELGETRAWPSTFDNKNHQPLRAEGRCKNGYGQIVNIDSNVVSRGSARSRALRHVKGRRASAFTRGSCTRDREVQHHRQRRRSRADQRQKACMASPHRGGVRVHRRIFPWHPAPRRSRPTSRQPCASSLLRRRSGLPASSSSPTAAISTQLMAGLSVTRAGAILHLSIPSLARVLPGQAGTRASRRPTTIRPTRRSPQRQGSRSPSKATRPTTRGGGEMTRPPWVPFRANVILVLEVADARAGARRPWPPRQCACSPGASEPPSSVAPASSASSADASLVEIKQPA